MSLLLLFAAVAEDAPCWDFDGDSAFTYTGCDDD